MFQFVEKTSLFHKRKPYLKRKRGLPPFSKPSPLAAYLLSESGGSSLTVFTRTCRPGFYVLVVKKLTNLVQSITIKTGFAFELRLPIAALVRRLF